MAQLAVGSPRGPVPPRFSAGRAHPGTAKSTSSIKEHHTNSLWGLKVESSHATSLNGREAKGN
eukprot:291936-Amphidinium_carterae.1